METPGKMTAVPTDGNGSLARGIEQAGTGAHDSIDRISSAARPAVDRMAAGAHQAVDRAAEVAQKAAESMETAGGQIKEAHTRLMAECGDYVRVNPVKSLGIAAAAGYLLGRLLSSR